MAFKKTGKGKILSTHKIRKGTDKDSGEPRVLLEESFPEEETKEKKDDLERKDTGTQ